MAELDEVRKLSPDERIKRLKELEDERKKEIEQAEELIKETVRELAEAEEKKRIPIPQARATELSALSTAEEKQIVATHHLLASETAGASQQQQPATAASQTLQQQKSLEQVAAEEGLRAQQQAQQQGHGKPVYGEALEKARQSPVADYASQSQQTVTGAGRGGGEGGGGLGGRSIEEQVMQFYAERSVTSAEQPEAHSPQEKYFGSQPGVTGGYETRKAEEERRKDHEEFYRRRAGPA